MITKVFKYNNFIEIDDGVDQDFIRANAFNFDINGDIIYIYSDSNSSLKHRIYYYDIADEFGTLIGDLDDVKYYFSETLNILPTTTKEEIGLGNVDNTSDLDKPISTATQTALDLKINLSEKGQSLGVATLDSGGKIPVSQLPNTVMEYKGNWNAYANSPTLLNGTGNAGDVYRTSAAGTVDFGSGDISFNIGDFVIYSGTVWEKSINSNEVVSVAGKTGIVTLTKSDVGLSNVDNTSDLDKPVSTATQTALTNLSRIENNSLYAQTGDYYITGSARNNGTQITAINAGSALLIGTTSNDGVNKLQVTGNTKLTGTLSTQLGTTADTDVILSLNTTTGVVNNTTITKADLSTAVTNATNLGIKLYNTLTSDIVVSSFRILTNIPNWTFTPLAGKTYKITLQISTDTYNTGYVGFRNVLSGYTTGLGFRQFYASNVSTGFVTTTTTPYSNNIPSTFIANYILPASLASSAMVSGNTVGGNLLLMGQNPADNTNNNDLIDTINIIAYYTTIDTTPITISYKRWSAISGSTDAYPTVNWTIKAGSSFIIEQID